MLLAFQLLVLGCFLGASLYLPWRQSVHNRLEIMRRVAHRLADWQLALQGLGPVVLRGSLAGRPVELRVGWRPGPPGRGEDARYPLEARLELSHGPELSLRIRPDAGLAAVEKALGRAVDVEVAGGDRFDRRFIVEAPSPEDRAGLAEEQVRQAIHRLLTRWGLHEVRLESGTLVARGSGRLLGQPLLFDLLDALGLLAHAYDRRPAPEISLRPAFAWTGGEDDQARCPYCHECQPHRSTACCTWR